MRKLRKGDLVGRISYNKDVIFEITNIIKTIDNKEIYIINPKSNVKKIFTITGLDKIFKVEG